MKKVFSHAKRIFRKKATIVSLVLIIILILIVVLVRNGKDHGFEIESVALANVTNVVSETGRIRPVQEIDLSFARGGRVEAVYVREGSKVNKGDILAKLESGSLDAELRQARAALELEKGAIQRTDLALSNAEINLLDSLHNTFVIADDVVQGKVDMLFTNPESRRPGYGISITSGSTIYFIGADREDKTIIDNLRADTEDLLESFQSYLNSSTQDIEKVAKEAETTLQTIQQLLNAIASSLNNYIADNQSVQAVYESYRAEISSSRLRINTALTSLRGAMQNYNLALASVKTSPTGGQTEATRLREIRIEEAQARVDGIQARINDGYIRAPFSGVVTKIVARAGGVAGAGLTAITMISSGNHEILVEIPEADIQYIDVGDEAQVTFDAYRDVTFEAEVIYIPPQAKETSGIKVFEVVLALKQNDPRVRAGLSADVDIYAEERREVVAIPRRAIVQEAGITYVRVWEGSNSYRNQTVTLGLRGNKGEVEILEGLREGDTIITFASRDALKKLKENQ